MVESGSACYRQTLRVEFWEAKHWQCGIRKIRFGRNWEKGSKAGGFREEESGGRRLEGWEVLQQNGP